MIAKSIGKYKLFENSNEIKLKIMIQATHQINAARHIARSAQRQIKDKTGMSISIVLYPFENKLAGPQEMLKVIAAALSMDPAAYSLKTRIREVVELRFIAALLLRMHFPKCTLAQIAVLFGGQDHSSILSGLARAYGLIASGDAQFTNKYNTVVEKVNTWLAAGKAEYLLAVGA